MCPCAKLRVHPAPGMYISAAGCTIFGRSVHVFFRIHHYDILEGCMEKILDAQF